MGTSLVKMPFSEEVSVKCIYESEELKDYVNEPIRDEQIEKMYGKMKLGNLHRNRPYTIASFVTSIDGRIAFSDAPQGPLIARKNKLDEAGAMSDWWILNMLRSVVDGIIVGTGTIQAEADFTGHIFDEKLEEARIQRGLAPVPWNIVMSLDGTDIPYEHVLFKTEEVPVMICTSKKGLTYVTNHMEREYIIIDAIMLQEGNDCTNLLDKISKNTIVIIATGEEIPDSPKSFEILKQLGVDRLLIETPSYMHYLMSLKLMDELFLNYSCLYIGGKALTLGQAGQEFTSEEHPHTKVLSIHTHSDSFFYFRHKVVY